MKDGAGLIRILKDGPYLVTGGIPLKEKIITPQGAGYIYRDGAVFPQAETYTLCRCGKSKNPPFCDGQHQGFDGTETAERLPFAERAEYLRGDKIDLMDDHRCAFARFCHRAGGDAWELAENSPNPGDKEEAILAAVECPAGRLVPIDKQTGRPIEPYYEPGIDVLQDPEEGVSCGLFVKGGIPIQSSDGTTYEVRNRVVLCRCGASKDKPFCDMMHLAIGYGDGRQNGEGAALQERGQK
ncbi:MAG: CDGSH iron-sulfur domain-containing protein [Bacillota bacterium]